MEEKHTPDKIDYIVHEGILVRQERHIKRLWILCIALSIALVVSNVLLWMK